MKIKKLAIFDWDGTLVDNAGLVYEAVCAVFANFSVTPPPPEVYFENITSDFLPFYRAHGLPAHVTREGLYIIWTKFFKENQKNIRLRSGAKELLQHYERVVIVSGTSAEALQSGLNYFKITHLVHHTEVGKADKVVGLQKTLDRFGIKPHEAMYVDDTYEGVSAARIIGITAIGITGGFHSEAKIREANPDHIISSLDELFTL